MISIRRMTAVDVPVSQVLLSQLGYQMDVHEVRRRYDAVVQSGDHALMVAEQGGRIIALCHTYARPALDKPPGPACRWGKVLSRRSATEFTANLGDHTFSSRRDSRT